MIKKMRRYLHQLRKFLETILNSEQKVFALFLKGVAVIIGSGLSKVESKTKCKNRQMRGRFLFSYFAKLAINW